MVGVLLAGSMAIGGALWVLEWLFPKHKAAFEFLGMVDIVFVAGLFCLFMIYTSIIVVTRLWRSIAAEFTKRQKRTDEVER